MSEKDTSDADKEAAKLEAIRAEQNKPIEMVKVTMELVKPFYDFLKDFQAFNGSQAPVEDVCQQVVYNHVREVYLKVGDFFQTEEFLAMKNVISRHPWARKWSYIGCTAGDKLAQAAEQAALDEESQKIHKFFEE